MAYERRRDLLLVYYRFQADMYRCSANCCDNQSYAMEDAQHCVEKCSQPLQASQEFIGQEMQSFQVCAYNNKSFFSNVCCFTSYYYYYGYFIVHYRESVT